MRSIKLLCTLGVVVLSGGVVGFRAIHTSASPTVSNPVWNQCVEIPAYSINKDGISVVLPTDEADVCGNNARANISPNVVVNAVMYAQCLGKEGIKQPTLVASPISMTFLFPLGVNMSSSTYLDAVSWCHANAPRVTTKGLDPNCGPYAWPNTPFWINCQVSFVKGYFLAP